MENKVPTLDVFRQELKYLINKREAYQLKHYLMHFMQLDSYSGPDAQYWIRSLYFDSYNNRDYHEKQQGCSERKTIRIRIYNMEDTRIKLELKSKRNSFVHKETVVIEKEDALKLINGDFSCLLKYQDKVAAKIYAHMHSEMYKPRILVDYEREAYFYPYDNTRITIDKHIRASLNVRNLFVYDTPMKSVMDDDRYILEIKYNTVLPGFVKSFVSSKNTEYSSISKYYLARQAIHI